MSDKFHKKKTKHLFVDKSLNHENKRAHGSLVKFYETSNVTNARMDEFNAEVNLGKPKTPKEKEQDIFQKVRSCRASSEPHAAATTPSE